MHSHIFQQNPIISRIVLLLPRGGCASDISEKVKGDDEDENGEETKEYSAEEVKDSETDTPTSRTSTTRIFLNEQWFGLEPEPLSEVGGLIPLSSIILTESSDKHLSNAKSASSNTILVAATTWRNDTFAHKACQSFWDESATLLAFRPESQNTARGNGKRPALKPPAGAASSPPQLVAHLLWTSIIATIDLALGLAAKIDESEKNNSESNNSVPEAMQPNSNATEIDGTVTRDASLLIETDDTIDQANANTTRPESVDSSMGDQSDQAEDVGADGPNDNFSNDTSLVEEEHDEEDEVEDVLLLDWNADWTKDEILDWMQQLRTRGKELHDIGFYEQAAKCFAKAADGLHSFQMQKVNRNNDDDDEEDRLSSSSFAEVMEDLCTCRLHQALCHLKQGEASDLEAAIQACNQVLMVDSSISPSLKARALYRRAKARLAMVGGGGGGGGTTAAALSSSPEVHAARNDARQAAFLGDRKAVELYGQLLRGEEAAAAGVGSSDSTTTKTKMSTKKQQPSMASSLFSSFLSSAQDSSYNDLFNNRNDAKDLFSALLGNAAVDDEGERSKGSSLPSLAPLFGGEGSGLAGMASLLGGLNSAGGGGRRRTTKGVGSNLVNTLSSKSTQKMICAALHSTSPQQIQQYATMAGVPLSEKTASRLVRACHNVEPKHLQFYLSTGQRIWFGVQLMRKIGKVLAQYRTVLVILFLLVWVRSLFE
ncbi:hypothetical protein ACA910_019045 [Epithemia clementina (nom. ined.)]